MKKESLIATTLIVVAILIFAAYQMSSAPVTANREKTVRDGSKVQVEYIGMLEPRYGSLVFDTSMYDVAADNQTYPKVATFRMHEKSLYKPLKVHVGEPSDGGYAHVVEGFSEGLIGMKVGETRTITVPPEKGYGMGNSSLVRTLPLVEDVRMRETYSTTQFSAYFDESPHVGMIVEHPKYHWPVVVENVFENYVSVRNNPELNSTYSVGPWNITVLSIDNTADGGNGSIEIRHLLTKDDIFRVKGTGYLNGQEKTFILTDVNESAGTYTIDYNDVTQGRTLVFWVKLVSIDVY